MAMTMRHAVPGIGILLGCPGAVSNARQRLGMHEPIVSVRIAGPRVECLDFGPTIPYTVTPLRPQVRTGQAVLPGVKGPGGGRRRRERGAQ
jgi:hypothetical protein